jgi:hypothetical protein
MKRERNKVVTRGAVPQTKEPRALPGSVDAIMGGDEERPPELVLLATIKVLNAGLIEGDCGEGYIVELDFSYGPGGMHTVSAGTFRDSDEALDVLPRLVRHACREAEEFGIDPLPKG